MVYRDYFRAVSVDSRVPDFAQRLRKFTRDMACEYMLGKEFEKLTDRGARRLGRAARHAGLRHPGRARRRRENFRS